ncbi:MAG: hypothetical protein Q9200_006496 [Gallowayella weberi]
MASLMAASPIILVSVMTVVLSSLLLRRRSHRANKPADLRRIIPSPRKTLLPSLSQAEADTLAYAPDHFPGARDVETHYGSMRVYEWGPEHGAKILLIHGDTTPGPMLGPIAKELVKKGYLWGRGYSDTPLDIPHDSRLFAMQILLAVASSSLSWTGTSSGGFSIVAFSLGGGISVSFAAHYPYLVNSIVLLAPAGLLRCMPDDYESVFFRYSKLVPSKYLRRLVGKLLGVTNNSHTFQHDEKGSVGLDVPNESVTEKKDNLDIPAIVQWQFDFHEGFCHSFVDTIAYGPIMHQQSDWKRFSDVIYGKPSSNSPGCPPSRLQNKKVMIVFGASDAVVDRKQVSEDLISIFGDSQYLVIKTVGGGHGFPVPSCEDVFRHICDFWTI